MRGLKIAAWAAVFLGAAGVGASIAANSELFPPGVEGPTTTDSPVSPSTTPAPTEQTWSGTMRSVGVHDLYVGGRCTTRWITELSFEALDNGMVVGAGRARLDGDLVCTSPNAQVNAEEIEVSVAGTWDDDGFHLRLQDGDRTPRGTADYGGFAPTVFIDGRDAVMDVAFDSDTRASATIQLERVDDQGRGRYRCTNRLSLALAR